jgi:hypothetical protein
VGVVLMDYLVKFIEKAGVLLEEKSNIVMFFTVLIVLSISVNVRDARIIIPWQMSILVRFQVMVQ